MNTSTTQSPREPIKAGELATDRFEKLSEHQFEFQTKMMKVPARFFMSEALLPKEETFLQVANIAANDGLFRHTVAMPDVCSKPGRKNASGTTIVSTQDILPQVNDSDPNCGMRLVRTSLTDENTTPEELDILFQHLVSSVPTKAYVGTKIPFDTVVDVCRKGTKAIIDHLGIQTRNELENTQHGGNFFGQEVSRRDIFDAIPKLYLFFAKYRLGLLGAAGNHFLDLMKITDIVNPEIAAKFNLSAGQYAFLIHTGSGILGQYTMYSYTAKKREHLSQSAMVKLGSMLFNSQKHKTYAEMKKKMKRHMSGDESLLRYDGNTPEGELYMAARNAASNFGTANRATITHNVSQTIKQVLGRDPEMDLLYDLPHISINHENHFDQDVWVHRNNTSRAYGPSHPNNKHPLFSQTGEPVFVPSSMSTDAYICVGTDSNAESFFSAPHGTGKGRAVSEDIVPQNREELMAKMEEKGVRLYNAQSKRTIEQDSSQYKSIDAVMHGVEDNGIGQIVAKMQPVSVIMY